MIEKEELLDDSSVKSLESCNLSRATDRFHGFRLVSLKAYFKVRYLKVLRHISKRVDRNSTFINFPQPV